MYKEPAYDKMESAYFLLKAKKSAIIKNKLFKESVWPQIALLYKTTGLNRNIDALNKPIFLLIPFDTKR